jgi:transcriptional regulator with XRE-family HTH domain
METLLELRKEKGITQMDVAKVLDISRQAYANYEIGKREPDLATLLKLADFFGVSVDYLLRQTEQKEKPSPEGESDEAIKVALFGGDTEVTDEMWREVLNYADFLKQKYNKT